MYSFCFCHKSRARFLVKIIVFFNATRARASSATSSTCCAAVRTAGTDAASIVTANKTALKLNINGLINFQLCCYLVICFSLHLSPLQLTLPSGVCPDSEQEVSVNIRLVCAGHYTVVTFSKITANCHLKYSEPFRLL